MKRLITNENENKVIKGNTKCPSITYLYKYNLFMDILYPHKSITNISIHNFWGAINSRGKVPQSLVSLWSDRRAISWESAGKINFKSSVKLISFTRSNLPALRVRACGYCIGDAMHLHATVLQLQCEL